MKKIVFALICLISISACQNNNVKSTEVVNSDTVKVDNPEERPEPGLTGFWKGKVDFTGGVSQFIQLHLYTDSTYVRTQMNSSTGSKKFYEIGCWKVLSDTLLMLDGSGLSEQYMAIKPGITLSYRDRNGLIPSNLTSEFFEKKIEVEEELPGDYKFEGLISYDKKSAKFYFCIAQRRLEIAKTSNYSSLIENLKSHGVKEGQEAWVQVTGHLDNRVAETENAPVQKFYPVRILKLDSSKTCQ
jgi:hypothetical protein